MRSWLARRVLSIGILGALLVASTTVVTNLGVSAQSEWWQADSSTSSTSSSSTSVDPNATTVPATTTTVDDTPKKNNPIGSTAELYEERVYPSVRALTDIPPEMLTVYRIAASDAPCELPWALLAGIADVASDHARIDDTQRRPNGTLFPSILSEPLNGEEGRKAIPDTDAGTWDDDLEWDRALGVFQFIPETWREYATDGNGDQVRDPQNVWDSAASAANHLCASGADEVGGLSGAIEDYYFTDYFVPKVLKATIGYATTDVPAGIDGVPDEVGRFRTVDSATQLALTDAVDGATLDLGTAGGEPLLLADWDGDGVDEPGVYRQADGAAALVLGGGDSGADLVVMGREGDFPLAGDWDGDGIDEPGLYSLFDGRGQFLRFDQTGETLGRARYGERGDQPVVGDWDGDGIDEFGIFRLPEELRTGAADGQENQALDPPMATFVRVDREGNELGPHIEVEAAAGARALAGDWDGDGIDSLAVFESVGGARSVRLLDSDGSNENIGSLADDELPLIGVLPEPPPEPVVVTPPSGTDDLQSRGGVEFFGIRNGPNGEQLRLWRVYGIVVEEAIAGNVAAMIEAAAADGIVLTGWGWRSSDQQVALRRQNCPDVYDSPASACSPPTARPGSSRHEYGRAIDFHINGASFGASSAEYAWMVANAADYGLFNLPSESWHWSDTGG